MSNTGAKYENAAKRHFTRFYPLHPVFYPRPTPIFTLNYSQLVTLILPFGPFRCRKRAETLTKLPLDICSFDYYPPPHPLSAHDRRPSVPAHTPISSVPGAVTSIPHPTPFLMPKLKPYAFYLRHLPQKQARLFLLLFYPVSSYLPANLLPGIY